MKFAWIAVLLPITTFAAGKVYDLKVDIANNGERFGAGLITVKENETATLIQKTADGERFIQVTPTRVEDLDGIQLQMTVGKISKDGSRTVLSRPEVIVEENSPAKLTEEGEAGKFSMSVFASEQKL